MATLNLPSAWSVSASLGAADLNSYLRDNLILIDPYLAGWKKASLPAPVLRPTDTNGCGSVQQLSGGWIVRAFDAAAAEYASINITPPAGWTGNLKAAVVWTVNDTNSGDVLWKVSVKAAASGETASAASTETIELSAAPGVAQELVATTYSDTIAFDFGDTLIINIYRDAADASDDYAADAYLIEGVLYFEMDDAPFEAVS